MNTKLFSIAVLGMVSLALHAGAQTSEPAIEDPAPPIIEKMPIPPLAEPPAPPKADEGAKAPEPAVEPVMEPAVEPVMEPEPTVPVPVMAPPPVEREAEAEAEMVETEPESATETETEPATERKAEKATFSSDDYVAPRSSARSSKSVVERSSTSSKDVVDAPTIAVESPLGLTLSAGYMSKYVFYGADLGDHGIWTGVDFRLLDGPIPIDIGLWYLNLTDPNRFGPDDELDLYLSAGGPSVFGFDTKLTYTAFLFPEGPWDTTHELAATLNRDLFGLADWQTSAHYDFVIEGWYFETALTRTFPMTDTIGLCLGSGISYQIDYYENGGQWNHFFLMASLPISLGSNVALEPYLGYVVTLDALRYMDDRNFLHGGVSLSVSF